MAKQTVGQIEERIAELSAQKRELKRDEALESLKKTIASGNISDILLACYRFTAQFRERKPKGSPVQ